MSDEPKGPSNGNEMKAFVHCGLCVGELREGEAPGESPETYARLAVGWTGHGLQVWCTRHDVNVINVDFEGRRHPANTTRRTH